jgi:hypothetical protein
VFLEFQGLQLELVCSFSSGKKSVLGGKHHKCTPASGKSERMTEACICSRRYRQRKCAGAPYPPGSLRKIRCTLSAQEALDL